MTLQPVSTGHTGPPCSSSKTSAKSHNEIRGAGDQGLRVAPGYAAKWPGKISGTGGRSVHQTSGIIPRRSRPTARTYSGNFRLRKREREADVRMRSPFRWTQIHVRSFSSRWNVAEERMDGFLHFSFQRRRFWEKAGIEHDVSSFQRSSSDWRIGEVEGSGEMYFISSAAKECGSRDLCKVSTGGNEIPGQRWFCPICERFDGKRRKADQWLVPDDEGAFQIKKEKKTRKASLVRTCRVRVTAHFDDDEPCIRRASSLRGDVLGYGEPGRTTNLLGIDVRWCCASSCLGEISGVLLYSMC
nr:hypothetical protein CFP56_70581 [Quercus suber]